MNTLAGRREGARKLAKFEIASPILVAYEAERRAYFSSIAIALPSIKSMKENSDANSRILIVVHVVFGVHIVFIRGCLLWVFIVTLANRQT